MRIFRTRHFTRWMLKAGLSDRALAKAVTEMAAGLIDADLGGGVVKKRVSLPGRGKRGGARTLVATNRRDRWFFLFGFAKNERASLSHREQEALQEVAADLLGMSPAGLDRHAKSRGIEEVDHDGE